ncbi:hypothetical protein ACWV26_08250 [Rummeliibacillus sp. JY-2-4R]
MILKDVCQCEYTNSLKLEADYCADPIWCNNCGWNLDIDDFPLSDELQEELFQWTLQYKKMPKDKHNKMGLNLTEKVKTELGSDFTIVFKADK